VRIFIAGGTGAIGKRLVPLLVAAGHDVTATTRHDDKVEPLRELGAAPVVLDALDRHAVVEAVVAARPDAVVHELTALASAGTAVRNFDRVFARTNELRTRGTEYLLEGAQAAGARRFVAQSYAGWPYAREGGPVKDEDAPLDPRPPKHQRRTFDAIQTLERAVLDADGLDGVVLRYGGLYGPGTSTDEDGGMIELVRRRRFPIIGSGEGVWSFVHVDDAAAATALAVEHGGRGIYNIVDDDPAPVREWLPALASALGAKPPLHVPTWVGRLAAGEVGVSFMTQVRGASNGKAKRQWGWEPRYPSWRTGFPAAVRPRPHDGSGRPAQV
jgi:nucleoside-diphosphate-sugar epimerase